ncbi:MAG: ParB N-terminal domain-containing protein [Pseudomonadota bacterium]|jgi:ParB family chromosome partitioning protein
MKLDFIDLGKLTASKANMRYAKKAPDVSDLLPTVRKRGVLVPVLVRPNGAPDAFEIVAGLRRFTAAAIVAAERQAAGLEVDPLPCAILDAGDDAAAIEASLIENIARLDPDEVTQWETFTRLVREGRDVADIADTFGLPDLAVRRVLALGNLLPRIRALYAKGEIDRTTVRHLTMASKSQQKAWLALADDPKTYCPVGHQLKAWLFGGESIPTRHALFDVGESGLATVTDLFGDDAYFADGDAFWTAQNAAIAERVAAARDAGWADAVIVPAGEHFASWEYEKAPKRKGGRVYFDVRGSGEVVVHEGYVSRKEARRLTEGGDTPTVTARAVRPEVTSALQDYIALHRHAAVRAALIGHGGIALRVMVAQAIAGSPLWTVRVEPQASRDDTVRESIAEAAAETLFDARRRAVLALLGFDPDTPTVTRGEPERHGATGVFLRLMDLPDIAVMDVLTIVVGETLDVRSPLVDALGTDLKVDMADWWEADDAFFGLIRDKEVLRAMLAEVAGETIAGANANEKGKTMTRIIRAHLDGSEGRVRVEKWVPRWLAFPPAHYTERGGVASVAAHDEVAEARNDNQPEPPDTPAPAAVEPLPLAA